MGYQSTLLGAVGSVGSGISIAALIYRQSPEYQARVEKERLRVQNEEEIKKREDELSIQKEYEKKVAKANEKFKTAKETAKETTDSIVGLDYVGTAASYDVQTEALDKIQEEAERSYVRTGKSEYMKMRATARDKKNSLIKERDKDLGWIAAAEQQEYQEYMDNIRIWGEDPDVERMTGAAQASMDNAKEQKRKKKEMAK